MSYFASLYLLERTWRRVMTIRGISVERKTAMTTMSIRVVLLASLFWWIVFKLKHYSCMLSLHLLISNYSSSLHDMFLTNHFRFAHLLLFLPYCKSVTTVPIITISEVLAMLVLLVLDPMEISLFFLISAFFMPE